MGKSKKSAAAAIVSGKHVRLVNRDGWEYAERIGATGVVVVVAVTAENRLLLTEQFRPPVHARVIELPAGLSGDVAGHEEEDLAAAARRELLEETGYRARGMKRLTHGPPSAGLSNELVTFYRATGLKKVAPGGGDASEDIVTHEAPLSRIDAWLKRQVAEGKLIDPKVFAGLYFAVRRGKK